MIVDWEQVKSAVAKVVAGTGERQASGTAFYIGGRFVLTALHVVADVDRGAPRFLSPITLTFPGGHVTRATVAAEMSDIQSDWAVLDCAQPPSVTPLELRHDAPHDAAWRAFGYPGTAAVGEVREGETIAGTVRDQTKTLGGVVAIQLYCEEAAAGLGAPLHGFSGAPCLIEGRVAGLLRSTLVQELTDGRRLSHIFTKGGTVFACPASAVVAHQTARGMSRLVGSWRPPDIIGQDFVVFLSSCEGRFKKLEPVAVMAHKKLDGAVGPPHFVRVSSAFATPESFLDTVASLCRARVVVFDATDFEPAIMLLVGIRSVVRRGLTVMSVGRDYALGDALSVPFNVTDANIVAHSQKQARRKPDPVDLLADRIVRGLRELGSSAYVDNPVYDSIRNLPADRRGLIPKEDGVLVLCPFEDGYNVQIWEGRLRDALKFQWDLLREGEPRRTQLGVSRSLELNSPRLVTQALYEHIRRAQACVVDLTLWSENVLFEFGVRLASNREGTACLLAKDWVERGVTTIDQCQQIVKLFVDPEGVYDPALDWEEEAAFAKAYGPQPVLATRTLSDGSVHRVIAAALDVDHEPASRSVFTDLIDAAALFGKVQGSNAKPVGLYPGNLSLTAREDRAEFERLLTAWFHIYYLELSSGGVTKPHTKRAIDQICLTLLERHNDKLDALRERAGEDLRRVLDALADAFADL
jgi:hypothetical protein